MIKTKFIKQIHSSLSSMSSNDVWMERSFTLPFLINKNINVNYKDFYTGEVLEIIYDIENEEVLAYVEEDKELYCTERQREGRRSLEEIVKEYQECGWELKPQK